jgi:hypothetical protein
MNPPKVQNREMDAPSHTLSPRPPRHGAMADLAAWLSAVHKSCVDMLGPLDEDYGIDEVDGLLDLEPQHIDRLVAMLKLSPVRSSVVWAVQQPGAAASTAGAGTD